MSADSYIEYFLVFLGWLLSNAIWDIFLFTGIFALPILFKILQIWLQVREEGQDEGNKGALALPRMEHSIYISIVVILFAVVPVIQIDINTISFDKARSAQCGINVPTPQNSGFSSFVNDFNGKTASVPIWWYLVHNLSKGITRASIAAIPCGMDLRQIRFEVQNSQIKDPILAEEIQDFATMCYSKSHYKLKQTNTSLSDDEVNQISWIGSSYFLNTPGYYDTYTSTAPRAAWPYNSSRDSGYPDVGRGGYPTCKEWWSDSTNGLRARALESFEPSLFQQVKKLFVNDGEEAILKWMVSPQNVALSTKGTSYIGGNDAATQGDFYNRAGSTFGLALQDFTAGMSTDALKMTMPIVQGFLLMAITILIPLIMIFSAYSTKALITMTIAFFALVFVSFWWELASWVDDRMMMILYDSMVTNGAVAASGDFFLFGRGDDQILMSITMVGMYVALPLFWISALSWAGYSIGSSISSAMNSSAKLPEKAGEKTEKAVTFAMKRGR